MARFHKFLISGIIILFLFILFPINSFASGFRFFSDYMYITDHETTFFDEIIWFYQEDTLYGRVHSNDHLGIKNRPKFYHLITTSESDFTHGAGYNPWFGIAPQFNFPVAIFPERANILRENATLQGTFFENDPENPNQFMLSGNGEQWFYQVWPLGFPYQEEAVIDEGEIGFSDDLALFFDGDLSLYGDNIQGKSTIGASGNIYLLDNVSYADFDIDEMPDTLESVHYLGIVAEKNIIISDTEANGRGNGDIYRADHDSAHIVITAAILALDERVTFEHQNDVGDPYRWCDHEARGADERGAIWLRGSIAQKRRGYVHRSNCGGTGYDKRFHYDYRVLDNPPPFFPEIEWEGMTSYGTQTWQDTVITWDQETTPRYLFNSDLTLGPGTEINIVDLEHDLDLLKLVSTNFRIDATSENPARITVHTVEEETEVSLFYQYGVTRNNEGMFADPEWTGLQLEGELIKFHSPFSIRESFLNVNDLQLIPSLTEKGETVQPLDISSSVLDMNELSCVGVSEGFGSFNYNEMHGKLISRFVEIKNNTFSRYLQDFPVIHNRRPGLTIKNTAFAGQRGALVMGDSANISYSGYFGFENDTPFSDNIVVGEGMLEEVDPMYSDIENGDYTLSEGSPYINAGDPLSDWDPDGTPPDIGAYFFNLSDMPENLDSKALANEFTLHEPYPNPFNATLTVPFELHGQSQVNAVLFNLLGQEVWSSSEKYVPGFHKLTLDNNNLVSGLYLLQIRAGDISYTKKALLLK
ncbi:T9SS type A sorting domain-containing protein [bacterium]|nr:T9SS type A sorting domain-containing protein [bacterium]